MLRFTSVIFHEARVIKSANAVTALMTLKISELST
jgi:hypothetical protein